MPIPQKMNDPEKNISKKAGLHPGALVHVGRRKADKIKLTVFDYNQDKHSSAEFNKVEEFTPQYKKDLVSWINIDGLHDITAIAALGEHFGLHPLLMEDVLNTSHRPKVEEFDNYLFLTLKMLGLSSDGKSIVQEQVSFVLGDSWVISFQEQEGDLFDVIRERIRESKGNIRKMGADYLLYRLIDVVVDNYFIVTENISEATERLEEKVLKSPDEQTLQEIQRLKKQLINLRKTINPLREAVSILQKGDNPLIKDTTIRYLRDVYEHIIQVADSIETHRDMLASIMDLYLSGISNKMNQVMKVLTIIATIFIPLTFVAGIYGMNFENMPELHWKYGYFAVWGFMLVVFIFMMIYFKRKKWL